MLISVVIRVAGQLLSYYHDLGRLYDIDFFNTLLAFAACKSLEGKFGSKNRLKSEVVPRLGALFKNIKVFSVKRDSLVISLHDCLILTVIWCSGRSLQNRLKHDFLVFFKHTQTYLSFDPPITTTTSGNWECVVALSLCICTCFTFHNTHVRSHILALPKH